MYHFILASRVGVQPLPLSVRHHQAASMLPVMVFN
jgi:hypothetical protein